jgi:hypothetical protein
MEHAQKKFPLYCSKIKTIPELKKTRILEKTDENHEVSCKITEE